MGFYAEPWLREARDHIKSMPMQTAGTQIVPGDFDKLADAVEKAIKAALVEQSGTIPRQLEGKNLVSICQSTGVWEILPPALRGLVQEVASLRSTGSAASHLPNSAGSIGSIVPQSKMYKRGPSAAAAKGKSDMIRIDKN